MPSTIEPTPIDRPDAGPSEAEIVEIGRRLAGTSASRRLSRRRLEDWAMAESTRWPTVRAALFRAVDVAPACRDLDDLGAHLAALMTEGDGPRHLSSAMRRTASTSLGRRALGRVCSLAVGSMAQRFIVGPDVLAAREPLRRLWQDGYASSLDLLGEATVTQAEADLYRDRCLETIVSFSQAAREWPARGLLDRDGHGPVPRANLSVKVSALTLYRRHDAPQQAATDAGERLRVILRAARESGAHVHIDAESMDMRETVHMAILDLLAEAEFRVGPSVGLVLQAYLTDSGTQLDEMLAHPALQQREPPLTIRLVKGAYWDHESSESDQKGWPSPVFARKADSDREFERLSRALIDRSDRVRVAIASHNLRSLSHAIAYQRASAVDVADVEFQVLHGLGEPAAKALAAAGHRVRIYCPIGDLLAGMAYLVRRLLENSSNDSFLANQAHGAGLDELLRAP